MAKSFVIHACLIFLTFCPGKGTNRWKKVIHNYKRDFGLQKRIYDSHRHEIEEYGEYYDRYEDYPDIVSGFDNTDYDEKSMKKSISKHTEIQSVEKTYNFNNTVTKSTKNLKLIKLFSSPTKTTNTLNKFVQEKWPKFEDILLEIGKKYDWKNDRWIKVKKKMRGFVDLMNNNVNKSIQFHEKHRFIYRIVRLNRPKNKRNIVLAVTAVR